MRITRVVLMTLCGFWLASAILLKPCSYNGGLFGGMTYVWLTARIDDDARYQPELHIACVFAAVMITAYFAVLTSPAVNRRQRQVSWMAPATLSLFLGFSFPASMGSLFGFFFAPVVAGVGSIFAVVTCFMLYLRNDCL